MNLKTKYNKINGLKKETTYVIIFYLKKKVFLCSKTVCVDEVLNILEDCWQQRRYKMY
jgi:hypothetical protein